MKYRLLHSAKLKMHDRLLHSEKLKMHNRLLHSVLHIQTQLCPLRKIVILYTQWGEENICLSNNHMM